MPKIRNCSILDTKPKEDTVGLSYCSQSHRFSIHVQLYNTGEAKVKHKVREILGFKDLINPPISYLPKRNGEIYQQGLTNHAKKQIKLASRIFQWMVAEKQTQKAYASFITLTYGMHYPSDHLSKKHLDNFVKRIKRKYPHFQYVWVAEKQKRGAIHYHILTPHYIDKEVINKAWNGIVQKWQRGEAENGCKQQEVYPNVGKVYSAGKYMTKYMQKEEENIGGNMYGIDFTTRDLMKPKNITFESSENLNEVTKELAQAIKSKDGISFENTDFHNNHQEWISQVNEFRLKEFIEYEAKELNLKKWE